MPLTLRDLADLGTLSDLAYGSSLQTPLATLLGGSWRLLTPTELGLTWDHTEGSYNVYVRNGQELSIDLAGYLRFYNNAGFAAVNESTHEVAMVFAGTDSLVDIVWTDLLVPFDELNADLAGISQFTDAVASYAASHPGYVALSAGHSLGGALAEQLVLNDPRYSGGASIGGPGYTGFLAGNGTGNFLHIAHAADPVGGLILPNAHMGSNAIFTDLTYGTGLASHSITGYESLFNILATSSAFKDVSPTAFGGLLAVDRAHAANLDIAMAGAFMVVGSPYSDILEGSQSIAPLHVEGAAGNDILEGGPSDDVLAGGADADHIYGGAGADHLYGDAGNDKLEGGFGDDTLIGGAGADIYIVHLGENHEIIADAGGADGSDQLWIYGGSIVPTADRLVYAVNGQDLTITARDANGDLVIDVTIQGMGTASNQIETLRLFGPDRALVATVDLTTQWQNAMPIAVAPNSGTPGSDFVEVRGPGEAYSGGDGDDHITGKGGGNILFGEGGNDGISVLGSNNYASGGDGDDVLARESDLTVSYQGNVFDGGNGDDTYYVGPDDTIWEDEGGGHDRVDLSGYFLPAQERGENYYLPDNVEDLSITWNWNVSVVGELDSIFCNSLDNRVGVSNSAMNVFTLDGNDTIFFGGAISDQVRAFGGSGDDTYYVHWGEDLGRAIEFAGEGNDTIVWSGGQGDTLFTGTLPDNIENFRLDYQWLDRFAITGNSSDNQISGGDHNDTLIGLAGEDILIGGAGADILTGSTGNDTFKDSAAGLSGDTITDFSAGDRIIITDANIAGFTFSISGNTLTFTGGSLTLSALPSGTFVASAAAGGGVQLAVGASTAEHAVENDFNGDAKSDILWRHENGALTDWLGTASAGFAPNGGNLLTVVDTDWQVAETGDFNGDGKVDVLWHRADGALTDWLGTASGGLAPNGANLLEVVSTQWQIAGVGDFNGDGKDDVLWHRGDGALTDWLGTATGGLNPNGNNLLTVVDPQWQIAGIGDFNGDGTDDVLWHRADGATTTWLGTASGGLNPNSNNFLTVVDPQWQIAGVGDFNGDGKDDVIWHRSDGAITDWLGTPSGGLNPNGGNFLTVVSTQWNVAAIGDYNGDHRDDLLWRNADGRMTDWLGTTTGGFTDNLPNAYQSVDTHWHVQPYLALV